MDRDLPRNRARDKIIACVLCGVLAVVLWLVRDKDDAPPPARLADQSGSKTTPLRTARQPHSPLLAETDTALRALPVAARPPAELHGFLFFNGQYIDAPYKVTTTKIDEHVMVLVNGIQFDWVRRHLDGYVANIEPLPVNVTENSSFRDLEEGVPPGEAWHFRMNRWLSSHFPPEEAFKRSIAMYRSLPFVEKVVVGIDPDLGIPTVTVWTKQGEKRFWVDEGIDLRPPSDEVFAKIVRERIEHWEEMLSTDTVVIRPYGGEIVFSAASEPYDNLPEIVDVLKSADAPARKADRLNILLFGGEGVDLVNYLRPFLTKFRGSPQLDARMAWMRAQRRRPQGQPAPDELVRAKDRAAN